MDQKTFSAESGGQRSGVFRASVDAGVRRKGAANRTATNSTSERSRQRSAVEGHTLLCTFSRNGETWKVYEDLRTRDGAITFVSSSGTARVLRRLRKQAFADDGPQHLGLDLKDIGMAGPTCWPISCWPTAIRTRMKCARGAADGFRASRRTGTIRPRWNTIVGTRECSDTMPVYPSGSTRTYHPVQYFRELTLERARNDIEGPLGGWMPAVRKVMPGDDGSYYEVVVFGDVLAKDRFIVQTWHRTAHIQDGKIVRVEYGYSYPAYTRRRQDPKPEEFYRGLLEFAEYWDRQLHDLLRSRCPIRAGRTWWRMRS